MVTLSLSQRFTAAMLPLLVPAVAAAQTIRGVVVDPAGAPLSGVVVLMLNSGSTPVGRSLSNERGEFRLSTSTAGTYRVRTLRIGFRPTTSSSVQLGVGAESVQRLVLTGLPLSLDTIRVAGRNVCRSVGDSSTATFALWEQVRGALTATQLTAGARVVNATTVIFDRTLDPDGRRVLQQSSNTRSDYVSQPWRAPSPDSLHRAGYVVTDRSNVTTYHAPGLDMLVSSTFIDDHCFKLTSDRSRLGVAFEPTSDRRDVPEIRGTVWLDRATSELRGMDYRYVHLLPQQEDRAGGGMEFVRMANGSWAISRWDIRMPVVVRTLNSQALGGDQLHVTEVKVTGGELTLARRGSDTLWSRAPLAQSGSAAATRPAEPVRTGTSGAVFSGVVVGDSAQQSIAGADVSIPALGKGTLTDATGAFRLTDIPAGRHRVSVRHLGYTATDTTIDLETNQTLERRIVLARAVTLDTVVSRETAVSSALPEFEEHRKLGLGHFLTRAELAKMEGQSMSSVLWEIPGAQVVRGHSSQAWLMSKRSSRAGRFPDQADADAGAPPGCYSQIYLDKTAVYAGRTHIERAGNPPRSVERLEPLFDLNQLTPSRVEAIEYFATPAETPMKYSGNNTGCGVLVIWTRR
jgi:hypothetical protein